MNTLCGLCENVCVLDEKEILTGGCEFSLGKQPDIRGWKYPITPFAHPAHTKKSRLNPAERSAYFE